MGNCVEAVWKPEEAAEEEKKEMKGGMRIKVVLTKEELEWLMEHINERGGRNLEDLLEEIQIERGRRSRKVISREALDFNTSASWKPSLESIVECPELPDHMQR
ncbi:uncharacterized protein LOC111008308 [Momordica charantia]|uniref:Uncharacterized protein LOC111008308 n=1 Tax=Momordica charantia TaxID=3673 RepID=A0A6J1C443_MOMCH|nr:uncharacterized protein LOC111008308 [Momordica charantia]